MTALSLRRSTTKKNGWVQKRFSERYYLKVFLFCLMSASIMILPFVFREEGLFTLYDDFNLQQIPFNMQANQAVREGEVLWNWYADLGSQFIGSQSFYTLGSPFFWLGALFEPQAFPYLIAPILILKYCVAGVTSYAYLSRFVKNKNYAVIGALLYAFCGFQTANLLFNHFHDVVAFFPLMLVALEYLMAGKGHGLFALAVAVNAFVNFFFFAGEIVFLLLYFCIRFLLPDFKKNIRKVPFFILEGILGTGIAAVLLLPSVLFTVGSPRVQEAYGGWDNIFYQGEQYLNLLRSVLLPADVMSDPSVTYAAERFDSCFAWLPLCGIGLVLAYMWNNKKSWITRLLIVCAIVACIPFLNSIFYGMTATPYFRWFYMPVLIGCLATVIALDRKVPAQKGLLLAGILTGGVIAVTVAFGWVRNTGLFAFYAVVACAGLLLTWLLLKKRPKRCSLVFTVLVIVFSVITGAVNIGWMQYYGRETQSPQQIYGKYIERSLGMELPQEQNYRILMEDDKDNFAMVSRIPSVSSFTSTLNGSVFEFYKGIGVERLNISYPNQAGVPELLSVKYELTTTQDKGKKEVLSYNDGLEITYVYERDVFLPIGFSTDQYMTQEQLETVDTSLRGVALLGAAVVSEEEIPYLQRELEQVSETWLDTLTKEKIEVFAAEKDTSFSFERDTAGFRSKIRSSKNQYMYFNVPYDAGWNAMVNGKEVQIIRSNGMMLVPIDKGENKIIFRYTPQGLVEGVIITVSCIGILVVYMYRRSRKREQ